jgi:hypothetical protein
MVAASIAQRRRHGIWFTLATDPRVLHVRDGQQGESILLLPVYQNCYSRQV